MKEAICGCLNKKINKVFYIALKLLRSISKKKYSQDIINNEN